MLRKGELVRYHWPSFLGEMDESFDKGIGIVTSVEMWADKGAPDRNCGVHVEVYWPDGTLQTYEEDELELIDDE